MMEMYAVDPDTLPEQEFIQAENPVTARITQAWYLRERDCARARQLADAKELHKLPQWAQLDSAGQQNLHARQLLIQGSIHHLATEVDTAADEIEQALSLFQAQNDLLGCGDACFCLASVWHDKFQKHLREACLLQAREYWAQAGNPQRVALASARILHYLAFRDQEQTQRELQDLAGMDEALLPEVRAWLDSARGVVAVFCGNPANAIQHFMQAFADAHESGQIRHAIVCAGNAADAFATLGDLHASLEWCEYALDLARKSGMRIMLSSALIQIGNTLRLLGRLPEAHNILQEAMQAMQATPNSPTALICMQYLGELALDMGQPELALEHFARLAPSLSVQDSAQMLLRMWRGQAKALSLLGQIEAAVQKLEEACTLATNQHATNEQIELFCIYASLYQHHPLPDPPAMQARNARLHWLLQALALGATMKDFIVPPQLLDMVAAAYADCEEYAQAYHYATAAAKAREEQHLLDANNRAMAMEMRHTTETARAEARHHRELAQTESERACALQEASHTLETLGLIGREITACLNTDTVFAALDRHVTRLLDTTAFCVYLLTVDGRNLRCAYAQELGQLMHFSPVAVDSPTSLNARCARERKDIFINAAEDEDDNTVIPGTLNTLSLLFTPLKIGERLLGVMSIQSIHPHAYGERERSIFSTLSAYGAIALDNAAAYALAEQERQAADRAREQADLALCELRLTQAKLVQSEKMASLGRLVAGVAHELNTPLGNGLVAISGLGEQLGALRTSLSSHMSRHALEENLTEMQEMAQFVQKSLERGASLVQTFKQLAVEQSGARRQVFQLHEVLEPVLLSLQNRMHATPWQLRTTTLPEVQMNSFPDALADVLTRLAENALVHGFAGRSSGTLAIYCKQGGHTGLRILVQDDGNGIAAADLGKVFDPFFTTQFGKGSSGLGLHIAHNEVTQVLGGTLTVFSTPGKGCEFEIDLPLVAPYNDRLD